MVSFELSDEQREIRDWVHAFAEKEIRPVAVQYDEAEEFPWPVVKKAAEVGLYGVDFLQQTYADPTGIMPALVAEELTWGCAGIALAILGSTLGLAGIAGNVLPCADAEALALAALKVNDAVWAGTKIGRASCRERV